MKEGKGSYVDAAKSSGTWPETTGIREKETVIFQNKFEVLESKVIQYGVEESVIRRQESVVVEYFKCKKKGHKCKKCLL